MKSTSIVAILVCAAFAQAVACNTSRSNTMSRTAQEYIIAFENGEDFTPPATRLIVNGKADDSTLQILGAELSTASPAVRENIVALLVDLGRRTDPLAPKGADVLQDQRILSLLVHAGFAKADIGREAAMDALRKFAPPADLSRFDDVLVKSLENAPTEEMLLLVAKSKPEAARARLEQMATLPKWQHMESFRIAQAALGDTEIENEFLALAKDAEANSDGQALGRALGTLALVGTPTSLKAIAERLRTPLTIDRPGAFEKSVRLSVLEALVYDFPDQPVLYPNNIITEANYTAAEQFCITRLGVTYHTPPPPFLTYRGYPIPLQ